VAQSRRGDGGGHPASPPSGAESITSLLAGLPTGFSGVADTLTELTRGIGVLAPATQVQADALLTNTQAIVQNTTAHSTSGVAGTITNIASSLTGGVLSLSPILSGLMHLFEGGGSSTPPPLVNFSLPPRLSFQDANTPGAGFSAVDYNQSGGPRAINSSAGASQPAPQVTIQVQAMDSRSFMDHSQDIAKAVREAMLNMHSLNDVISDL
jgi:hypothetical protein